MALKVDKRFCPQNHVCPVMQICPVGAISQDGFGVPVIDSEKCTECGKCKRYCPMHAIQTVN